MVFVKPSKSNAYFKRYQVKFRRRRDGKTDYRARIRLINQDKNKYNTPKYRFVVRFTNKDIVAQILSASIAGDIVKASAYAHELPQYGLTVGLTNYAAAYCTGLLLARRVLKMLEMDEEYEGNLEATGEDFSVEPTESRRPFRALLDVGLIRTTTGNRVFGALKVSSFYADGKTDYRARIRLINQDKNKYNTPKYRFVVRFTNKDIVAQILSASIAGDIVKASAYAHELPQYGLTVGLTNYAAAYCTGLLLARRVLKMLEMDEEYEGNLEATGEDFSVEPTESRRPFRALLDVGLIRTTTGNRVFGALKGALDGGLDIPHSDKRFAGFNKENKQLDAEIHRNYIYGGHVSNYMKMLNEDEPEKFQTHFSQYLKKGVDAETMEELYKKVHAAIRADPNPKKTAKPAPKAHKRYNLKKLTYEERKNKLIERVKALNGAAGGDDDDEEDEE
ncbi:hypothetical protein F2Q70_00030084 [Brassica cretica]|uniref:Large ribosomal subunit protein uL18 C-terminal eukaryotes domain-containing protein n=1 Tax=Brassica cretica TaxID=69181 RepID=A0A8S9FF34_BRACR|nr:hypothetical protein F2Q70_00030084 [Brassica cretica]